MLRDLMITHYPSWGFETPPYSFTRKKGTISLPLMGI